MASVPPFDLKGKRALVFGGTSGLGALEEIKGAAVFLASDAASFVTGEIIAVDGGFMAQGIGRGGMMNYEL